MDAGRLYQRVFEIYFQFAAFSKNNVKEETEKIVPLLEEFSKDFLKENQFGISNEEYQLLQGLWIEILKDIMEGLEQNDRVLLEDVMEHGLMRFLEIFFEEDELLELKEGCRLEPGDL